MLAKYARERSLGGEGARELGRGGALGFYVDLIQIYLDLIQFSK